MRTMLGIAMMAVALASTACQRYEAAKIPRKERAGLTSATAPETTGEHEAEDQPPIVETDAHPMPVETGEFPETPQPEIPQPEIPQPEIPQPEIPQPEIPQPEIPQPETPKPAPPSVAPQAPAHPPAQQSPPRTPIDAQAFFESVRSEIVAAPIPVEKTVLPEGGAIPFDEKTGQPAFAFSRALKVRFPKSFNNGTSFQSLEERQREKWIRIFTELRKASNFRDSEQKKYLFIDPKEANKASLAYEKNGIVASLGAWSIAVGSTAVRGHFTSRPCAEFVSEMIRQAYQRAGYSIGEDFNRERGNKLVLESSYAVRGLSKALEKAGWIPWDASKYRPPLGAPSMHEMGLTPGHTYLAAGDNGLWIVDNSKPRGRDLRKTDPSYVRKMYKTGLFFLPPGLNPLPWSQPE